MVRHIDVDKNARWGEERKKYFLLSFSSTDKKKALFYAINEAFRMNKIFVREIFLLYENLFKCRDSKLKAFWQYGNITTDVFVIIIFKRGSMEKFVRHGLIVDFRKLMDLKKYEK